MFRYSEVPSSKKKIIQILQMLIQNNKFLLHILTFIDLVDSIN